jgi:hypothetical protein
MLVVFMGVDQRSGDKRANFENVPENMEKDKFVAPQARIVAVQKLCAWDCPYLCNRHKFFPVAVSINRFSLTLAIVGIWVNNFSRLQQRRSLIK